LPRPRYAEAGRLYTRAAAAVSCARVVPSRGRFSALGVLGLGLGFALAGGTAEMALDGVVPVAAMPAAAGLVLEALEPHAVATSASTPRAVGPRMRRLPRRVRGLEGVRGMRRTVGGTRPS
jgi:hypothetical protein